MPRPVDRHVVEPVRSRLLELDPDALSQRRVTKTPDGLLAAPRVNPAGEVRVKICGTGEVRVRVHRHVDALGASLVDHRQELRRPSLVHVEPEMRMCVVEGNARPPGDVDAVPVGRDGGHPVVAVVRRVVAARLAEHRQELDELVVGRVHARCVGEPGGEADCSVLDALPHEPLHLGELGVGGRAVVTSHRDHANGRVGNEHRRVDADAAIEPVEVLGDAPPAPVELRWIVVPARELESHLREHLVGDRCVRETVLADHVAGDALVHLHLVRRVGEQLDVRVRVHVGEAGTDDQAGRVDLPRPAFGHVADLHDAVAADTDVRPEPGVAGAVDDPPVADDEVEHLPTVRDPGTRRAARS